MRAFLLIFLLLAGVLFLPACNNDFDVNAEWKEITIVYGLLEANKTVQYIKVNKAFLNENTSAIEIAQRMDSLYHNDSISVVLEEYVNGSRTQEFLLIKDTLLNKDSGVFHHPENILYRTPAGFLVNVNAEYIVRIKNPAKGTEVFASTPVVAQLKQIYPSPNQLRINFANYSSLKFDFNSGRNARFYNFEIVFNYKEYAPGNPSAAEDKSITWRIFEYWHLASLNGGTTISFRIETEQFYKLLHDQLPADGKIRESGNLQMIYSAGGDEIYNYLTINNTSLGVVQKRADYTNINNGYGIFSSRLQENFTIRLNDDSIDSLVNGVHTKELGFIR